MTVARIYVVRLTHTDEMTVSIVADGHDEAMKAAEHVFPGWDAVDATEDDK